MKTLFIIPARAGSKGLKNKNVLLLKGKPLIQYSIEAARQISNDKDICVSTDCIKVMKVAEDLNLSIPFSRPGNLSSDTSSSESVILHAIEYYQTNGREYDYVVLLQPTSPLRTAEDIKQAISLIEENTEMIVSVKETDSNPYYLMFLEDETSHLKALLNSSFKRRQDCPVVYELNGAIYVINVKKMIKNGLSNLKKKKFVMSKLNSVDIDDKIDFVITESLMRAKELKK